MGKAPSNSAQLGFAFDAPPPATSEAALAGLEQQVNTMVGELLNSDPRSREEIAGKASSIFGETITRPMLDAYASPARPDHKVPFSRLLALVVATNRFDLLDRLMRRAGAALLVGEEVNTARLGDIAQRIAALKDEERQIKNAAPVIRSGLDGE